MKKIPTNSFNIIRIISIVFIVIGLAQIAIMLGASIGALFIDGSMTFLVVFGITIVCSILSFLFMILPSFVIKGLCETAISFSDHISRQTKILEEINKKLDNEETQENSKQTKILKETNEKLDNEETDKKLDNDGTQE